MTNPVDPAEHRHAETRLIEHVHRLLDNPKLRIDTTAGMRPVAGLRRRVTMSDQSQELRREFGDCSGDPEMLPKMPAGQTLEVLFHRPKMVVLKSLAARLRVICRSPFKSLLHGQAPKPMTASELNRMIDGYKSDGKAPTTMVVMSTAGFALDTHDLAQRMASRILILVEPNRAGGFTVWGPTETRALNDLLDPETETAKRQRIRDAVKSRESELNDGGITAPHVADQTMLPLSIVEDEFKAIVKLDKKLRTQRLDGRVVLHREGAKPTGSSGGVLPLVERIRAVFSPRAGEEKRTAFFADRRNSLTSTRDALADEIGLLEKKDAYMCQQFKEAGSEPAKRRIAAQLVQLRKELDRRQQMLNVLRRHLAEVETVLRQIESRGKPVDVEEIAAAAAKAEEELTKLESAAEPTESVSAAIGGTLSAAEQAVYDELKMQ